MSTVCPACQADDWLKQGEQWQCQSCQATFQVSWLCDRCGQPVELLKACGAVNYFCNHCNELKSKSAVQLKLTPSGE